jgi:hypothetical protein
LVVFAIVALAFVAAGCGSPEPSVPSAGPRDENQLYETQGYVMEVGDRDPELCLGSIQESLPPQCDGTPMSGWDWDDVEGEETAGDTTWGEFYLTGRYDGETFTVVEAGPPEPTVGTEGTDAIGTPCTEPVGGWVASDLEHASLELVQEIQAKVSDEDDFVGLWIDYYNEPPGGSTEEDPGDIILNVSFTGDIEAHEQELRELWGGPLCMSQGGKSYKELGEIQRALDPAEFGLEDLWSDVNVTQNYVEFGVIVVDEVAIEKIDERYGPGVVRIVPRLRPVD